MRRTGTLVIAGNLWVVAFVGPVTADIDPQQVINSLQRGTSYLMREQAGNGTWADPTGFPGGVTSLCTLALLSASVEPGNVNIQKALRALRHIEPSRTYTVALQTMVFCAAEPKKDLVLIRRNAKWLEQTQIKSGDKNGSWSYGRRRPKSKPGEDGDNSNSQFAILALHEAERVGIEVSDATWQRAARYWQRAQNADGSWGYIASGHRAGAGTGSMTCAGIAGLIITADKITRGDASVNEDRVSCCGEKQENRELDRALAWLGRSFSVHRNPGSHGSGATWLYYYLYGLERAGRLTARRFIGQHDWYREGAEKLVREQDGLSGFWQGGGHAENQPHIATSLALLFLAKGRRPVLMCKMQHGPGDDWNNHRSDVANLTRYAERRWDRDLTWQVINPQAATVDDLLQAPVLFMNGQMGPEFTAHDRQKFRDYIDRGGFIFAEACCLGKDFDRGFRELIDDVFPEPEYKLRLLPPEHPIWRAEERVDPNHLRPLWGIEYGCRTCVVYCPEDLSCYWELSRSGRETKRPMNVQRDIDSALAIGVNVLTYATGREPRYKEASFQTIDTDQENSTQVRGTIAIAKLRHPGGCNAAPGALANLLRTAASQLKLRINTEDHLVPITDKTLFRYHLAFMHGRHQFRLTPAERKQLATYIERGGTLLVDAICASRPFASSFRREMKAVFPNKQLVRIPANHPMFTDQLGGYDLATVKRRDPRVGGAGQSLQARLREVEPDLEGIQLGDRYGVIFSSYDLSCALERYESLECPGYTREDAARIGLNVLLYSLNP